MFYRMSLSYNEKFRKTNLPIQSQNPVAIAVLVQQELSSLSVNLPDCMKTEHCAPSTPYHLCATREKCM